MLGKAGSSSSALSKAEGVYGLLFWPLIAYSLMAALTVMTFKGKSDMLYKENSFFVQHPAAMLVAFVAMAGNAALVKKVGGRDNTITHGTIMMAATLLAAYGFYVIYTNKVLKWGPGVTHFASLHGKVGLAVMVGYIGLAVVGAVALHPVYGIYTRQQTWVRFAHKWGGRAVTALSWVCCILGLQSMGKAFWIQAAFSIPLLFFGLFVLV